MTNEFIGQYYRDVSVSTLNVTIYAADGNVKCHTEVFNLSDDEALFPSSRDQDGSWIEQPGGYIVPCPFATVKDVEDVLYFCYLDVLIIQPEQLTLTREDLWRTRERKT